MTRNIDLEEKIQEKRKFNKKMISLTSGSTLLSAIPSIKDLGMSLENMKYFLIGSALGLAYSAYSNNYREKHSENVTKLVTTGPFSIHRNPENFGQHINTLSLGSLTSYTFILSGNHIGAVLAATTAFLIARETNLRIAYFDIELEQTFGQKYLDYKNNIPKYIPKIQNLFKD